ncbi:MULTISPECIES: helix-turn-helix domain-containing protein [unclassified Rhodococcus (in: high G+C Gram-positive bacteria)]|uniref:helix-turn-helix domain-containing protein n=1 Tax=Rhodococcus sp. SJ-3 TaxID=3454628 RepID=UPI003F78F3CB
MTATFSDFLRARRGILGLTQRDLATRSGVKQPLIAAFETGRRVPSEAARTALMDALVLRPSVALEMRRDEVKKLFARANLPEPQIFGSVARGDDEPSSDLDLIVDFTDGHDIVDLLALQGDLEDLLTVRVEVIDGRSAGKVIGSARAESVAL